MLKVGGIWVSPAELEHTLLEHPAVLACGVVGRPDHDGLIKPLAYVVAAPRTSARRPSWRRSCSSSRAPGSPNTSVRGGWSSLMRCRRRRRERCSVSSCASARPSAASRLRDPSETGRRRSGARMDRSPVSRRAQTDRHPARGGRHLSPPRLSRRQRRSDRQPR